MVLMLEEDSACLNPQAYKPDKFVNFKKNSLKNAPERDAFLIVISTLINENQCLKAENNLLRNKMLMQQLNPTGQAKQELPCSSDEYKLEKAQQERSRRRSNDTVQFSRSTVSPFKLKMCKYCRQVHRYGLSSCEAYGAVCSYCRQVNHIEDACFFKFPHLRRFKKNRSRKGSRLKEVANTSPGCSSMDSRLNRILASKDKKLMSEVDMDNELCRDNEAKDSSSLKRSKNDCSKARVNKRAKHCKEQSFDKSKLESVPKLANANVNKALEAKTVKEKLEVIKDDKAKEISYSRITDASKATMEEYPGELMF